jgi:hypothetical protein
MADKTICTTHLLLQEKYVEVEDQGMTIKLDIYGQGHILCSMCHACADRFAADPAFN